MLPKKKKRIQHKKISVKKAKRHQTPPRSAIIDHLTNLYNRRYFDKSLKKIISEAKKEKKQFSLLMIDIDKFKTINDRYGHLVGDKVLTELAGILRKSVRKVDICFRYGGDEITVILPNAKKQAAENIVRRLKNSVEKQKFTIEGIYKLQLKLSIGLAVFPDDGSSPEVLIKKADDLLYKAKRQKGKPTEPFILKTKLTPPVLKEKVIFRPLLISSLKKNLNKKLILICADAGYGKTTLLAQFCSTLNKPFMFYDLEPSDNDLATFFTYITFGIQQHYTDFGQRVKTIIPQTRDIEMIVGTLINEFVEKVKDDFYIILDDYHCLQQNKEIGNALDYLLRHLPINLHLIISSRSIPPLNLSFYQAKQWLFKLEKKHLQFKFPEIQRLLEERYNLQVDEREIKRVEKHSEGWITAIQLILQKIAGLGEDKAKEILNGYVSSGEEVFRYFARESFDTLSKEVQDFLMKTSIMDYLDKDSCDHLLDIKTSEKILNYLYTEHIFITKIGDSTYKYHPLFKEFLYKKLCKLYKKKEIAKLHRKLGNYFFSNKDYYLAANHFLFIKTYQKVIKILKKFPISESSYYPFIKLVNRVPSQFLNRHPKVLLKKLKILIMLGKWDEALNIAFIIKKQFKKIHDRIVKLQTLHRIGFIYLCLGQYKKAVFYLDKAYKLLVPKDKLLKGKLLKVMAYTEMSLGHYDRVERYIKEIENLAQKIGDPKMEFDRLNTVVYFYAMRYDFKKAAEIFLQILKHPVRVYYPIQMSIIRRNAATIFLELGDIEQTERLNELAMDTAKKHNDRRTIAYITETRGHLSFYKGDYEKALEYYNETLRYNQEFKEKSLESHVLYGLTAVNLAMNKIKTAQQLFYKAKQSTTLQISYTQQFDYLILEGRAEKNEGSFKKAMQIARHLGTPYPELVVSYYLGELYLSKRNEQFAKRYFSRCLQIAKEEGYDYFLVRVGRENVSNLEFCLRNGLGKELIIKVLKKIDTDKAKALLLRTGEAPFHLDISLFGRLVAKNFQGKVIIPTWKTHKAKSIFAYLLMNRGRRSTRDELIDNFWHDKGLADGIRNLHTNLAILRGVLKKSLVLKISKDKIILYKNFGYQLNPDIRFKLDVEEFDRIRNEAEVIVKTDKSRGIELYEKALLLYRDDFCKEFYDTWCEKFRAHYRERTLKLAKKLAFFYFKQNNYKKSLNFYRQAIKLNPLEEENHLGAIKCFAALGDKQSVQKQYYNLVEEFKKNLNTSPSNRVKKLYQEIIRKI